MAEIEKITCTCCGKEKKAVNPGNRFYQSQSVLYKYYQHIPVCKDCIDIIYNNYKNKYKDEKLAIYEFCRLFDLPYSDVDYLGAVQNSEKTGWKLYQSYFKQINSFGDVNNNGTCFADSDSISSYKEDVKKENESFDINTNFENFEITHEMKIFWGDFDKDEYMFLEAKFAEYINTYECDTPAMEELLQQAAFESLEIRRKRQKKDDVTKNLKNLQDLLGSANIKPNQETGANATEQATFGTLIKKWENEKPIPEPLGQWKKANWIEKYMRTWFFGHLAKMMGVKNPFESEYEEEMSKYKVDISSEDEDDGNGII